MPRASAQTSTTLAERIQKVISRPEFARANFGIKFVSLDTGKVLYSLNANKLFVPASTTKLLTEGTVLAKLGAEPVSADRARPEALHKFLQSEIAKWGPIIKKAGQYAD